MHAMFAIFGAEVLPKKEAAAGTVKLTLCTRCSLYLELKCSSGTVTGPTTCETDSMRANQRGRESMRRWQALLFMLTKNYYSLQTKKTKLNSDCTIKFVSINTSKQDVTWIYLDKVTSEPYSE
jgi:hypothetical protein